MCNAKYFLITCLIIGGSIWAKGNNTEPLNHKEKKSILLFMTTPITGYNTLTGLRYNFAPVGIEIPISKFIGIRIQSDLAYYTVGKISNSNNKTLTKPDYYTAIQSLNFSIILPFYFQKNKEGEFYNGFYIGPFAVPEISFISNTVNFGAGAIVGFAWNLKSNWHFNLGLGFGYDVKALEQNFDISHFVGGLYFDLGYWL